MPVNANRLLNETAKYIANSLFKNIDKQKINPNFLQNFADQLIKRIHIPQGKNVLAETKTVKELTSLVSQIKKTHTSLLKELNFLQKSIEVKDIIPLTNKIDALVEADKDKIDTQVEVDKDNNKIDISSNPDGVNVRSDGIKVDTKEEQREGRTSIIKGPETLQSVMVEDFSDKSLEKLKEVFTLSFGKDLEQKLKGGLLGASGASQGPGMLDSLINGALFGAGGLTAAGGTALLLKKLKDIFSGGKASTLPSGKTAPLPKSVPKVPTPKGLPKLSLPKFIPKLLRGPLAGLDAAFNVTGSVDELSQDKELGTTQKFGTGGLALLGAAPDILTSIFDPSKLVSTGFEIFGKESPDWIGEGWSMELANMLGMKEEGKSFGETLRKRSKEMFKEYNEYIAEREESAEENKKQRGGWSLESIMQGQRRAQKAGYAIKDITDKVTQEQFALYSIGKISDDEFKKIAGTPQEMSRPVDVEKKNKSEIELPPSKQKPSVLPEIELPLSKQKPSVLDLLPENASLESQKNLEKALQLQLDVIKNELPDKSMEVLTSPPSIKQNFESIITQQQEAPKLDTLLQTEKFSLNNDFLQKIVGNTEGTKDSIKILGRALDRLAGVLDKKTTTGETTIINANTGAVNTTPASVVAANNFDSIQQVRRQFALT